MNLPRAPQRTTPGFAFSMVERALMDCFGKRSFGRTEMSEVLGFFFGNGPPQCVYCGSSVVARWDHVVPVSKGGEAVLGNMVLSCASCDDSKRDVPYEEWMVSNVPSSPNSRGIPDVQARIARVEAYVRHFGYAVLPLDERLNKSEMERLVKIRTTLQDSRREIDSLIEEYRARIQGERAFGS